MANPAQEAEPAPANKEEKSVKKWLAMGVLLIAGVAALGAGTCTVIRIRLTDINGKDTFAGELKNDSGANFLQHTYIIAFIDGSNNVVETKTVEGCLRSLANGTSDFFSADSSLSASTTTAALSRLALDSTLKVGTTASGDVTITLTSATREGKVLTVKGKIKNNDSDKLVDGAVCVVIKDSSGNIVKVAKDNSINDLNDNEEDTFSLTIAVPDDTAIVDEIEIWVDGLDGSSSDNPIAPESDLANEVTEIGDADDLKFGVQPSNTTGGTKFGTDVTVKIVDNNGNTVPSATDNITLAVDTGPGTVVCVDNTVDAVAGVATFDDCKIDLASGTAYKLKATATSLTTAVSDAFNVTVGAAAKLAIAEPEDKGTTVAFTTQPVVTVQDAGGNTVLTSTASILLTLNQVAPGPGTLACTTPVAPGLTLAADGTTGKANYAGCAVTGVGTYTITASSGTLTPATTTSIVIAP